MTTIDVNLLDSGVTTLILMETLSTAVSKSGSDDLNC